MEQPTVVVNGRAEVVVAPDSFTMTATIGVRAGDAAAAHSGLAQRYTTLDRAVLALGADHIRLERGAISSWGEVGRMQRWHAHRALTVTCDDPGRVTEIAATLGRVADVQIDGPHWRVARDNPVHERAQTDAVRDARARAERYATALGGTLGRLVELRDGEQYGVMEAAGFYRAKGEDAALESMDLTPVPQTITASVQARWYVLLPD